MRDVFKNISNMFFGSFFCWQPHIASQATEISNVLLPFYDFHVFSASLLLSLQIFSSFVWSSSFSCFLLRRSLLLFISLIRFFSFHTISQYKPNLFELRTSTVKFHQNFSRSLVVHFFRFFSLLRNETIFFCSMLFRMLFSGKCQCDKY